MTRSEPDPPLAYRQTDEFLVVLALYEQLHDSFCQEFGPTTAPEYSVNDCGERTPHLPELAHDPGWLIPVHNGWAYTPECIAPLRLDEARLNPLSNIPAAEAAKTEETAVLLPLEGITFGLAGEAQDHGELFLIERRIYERAWTLGLLRSAGNILGAAIDLAGQDVSNAVREYRDRFA